MANSITLVDQNKVKGKLKDSCKALLMRKSRIQKKMRNLARDMRQDIMNDVTDVEKLKLYQEYNTQLRQTKIAEAELNYTMHML